MPRKKKEDEDPKDQDLQDVISTLDRSGATRYFIDIRKQVPGSTIWSWCRHGLPVDEVDNIRDHCFQEWGEENSYKIRVRNEEGKKVTPDRIIPALKAPKPSVELTPEQFTKAQWDRIKQTQSQLDLRKAQLEMERQEKKLQQMEEGADEYETHYQFGPPGYPPGYPHGYPYWEPPEKKNEPLAEAFKAMATIIAAQNSRPRDDSGFEMMKLMIPILLSKGVEPKDVFSSVVPMMGEISKAGMEANRLSLQTMAEADIEIKKRMIQAMLAGGKDDDEIDRWKRVVGLVTDGVGGLAKAVFGRATVLKNDGKVNVPVINKAQPPGLPQTMKEEPRQVPEAPKPTAAEQARAVITQRIMAFLSAHEQEMLVESDPVWLADKLSDVWSSFPEPLRFKLEQLPVDKIYETLREYDAETVDRILAAVKDDQSGAKKKWCLDFWEAMKHPPEEEGGEDGPEGEEPEPSPEPEAQPVGAPGE